MDAGATAEGGGHADLILGIESSCDETAAALLDRDGRVVASVVRSQIDLHRSFGGVVPEIGRASCRERVYACV